MSITPPRIIAPAQRGDCDPQRAPAWGDDRIIPRPRRQKASEGKNRLTRVIEPPEHAREFKEL